MNGLFLTLTHIWGASALVCCHGVLMPAVCKIGLGNGMQKDPDKMILRRDLFTTSANVRNVFI